MHLPRESFSDCRRKGSSWRTFFTALLLDGRHGTLLWTVPPAGSRPISRKSQKVVVQPWSWIKSVAKINVLAIYIAPISTLAERPCLRICYFHS
jgi:hypothetical protein